MCPRLFIGGAGMVTGLKAIETVYKGYRFRSRLEARWAVFLDTLGVPFEYEPEGFDLDGVWYLPDFWLPQQDSWLEIKPTFPDGPERRKCLLLAQRSGKEVFMFHTSDFRLPVIEKPYVDFVGLWGRVFFPDPDYAEDDEGSFGVRWVECLHCLQSAYGDAIAREVDLGLIDDAAPLVIAPVFSAIWPSTHWDRHAKLAHQRLGLIPGTATDWIEDSARLKRACDAARQARFEHGSR